MPVNNSREQRELRRREAARRIRVEQSKPQVERLDERLGVGLGAKRERAKLDGSTHADVTRLLVQE